MKELTVDDNYKTYTELINRLEDVKDALKKQNYGIAMDILYKPYPEFQITTSAAFKDGKNYITIKEWSKEDEYNHNIILYLLNNECVGCADKRIAIDWFKSLKDRYTWKPSDGQMKALKEACDEHWEPDGLDPLYILWEQLNKLKKE